MGSQPSIILCGLTWFDWSEWSFRAGFPRNEKNLYIYICSNRICPCGTENYDATGVVVRFTVMKSTVNASI